MNTDRTAKPRLLLVGLDAAEPSLIERWTEEGALPNLARLRRNGCYGRLATVAPYLTGSPWPTFYTGTSPGAHGHYHVLQWNPRRGAMERPFGDWLPLTPFWRAFAAAGPRPIVLDMPLAYPPRPFEGIEISGWAAHDVLGPPASHPPEALSLFRGGFGRRVMRTEVYGPQKTIPLLDLPPRLSGATEQLARMGASLMRRETWDLFFVGFGAAHRAGHKLWDETSAAGSVKPGTREIFRSAFRGVYAALDEAIGVLVEAAGSGTTVLVFSLHGMGPNNSREILFPEMLRRVLHRSRVSAAGPPPRSRLVRLRDAVPIELRRAVKSRFPLPIQDRLTAFWRRSSAVWEAAEAFTLPADQHGYVRINLKGRERDGVVSEESYESLRDAIAEGVRTFRDARSGEPIVADVVRPDRALPAGDRAGLLPDLVVIWSETPAAGHEAVASDRFGTIPWPTPGRNPDGRSGNHRGEGFLLAAGEGIPRGDRIESGTILDLAPTICARLGAPSPFPMEGKPLRPIAG
ncbi:MAG: alkaline phosphatase family protein [Candidatus Eisenbacteria bacterium]